MLAHAFLNSGGGSSAVSGSTSSSVLLTGTLRFTTSTDSRRTARTMNVSVVRSRIAK